MRVIVNGQVYVYAEAPDLRREELWEGVAQDTEAINKVAANDKISDINKVEAVKDTYDQLRLKCRELWVW